ncbi:hypothetical protein ACOME3_005351 [Neoechinorhynchus agilis]
MLLAFLFFTNIFSVGTSTNHLFTLCDYPEINGSTVKFNKCGHRSSWFVSTSSKVQIEILGKKGTFKVFESIGLNINDFPDDFSAQFVNIEEVKILEPRDKNKARIKPFSGAKKLSINNGSLTSIEQFAFDSFDRLTHLSLSHNLLERMEYEVLQDMKQLTHLELSYNKIRETSPIVAKCGLKYIGLSHNDVRNILISDEACLKDLDELDLRFNPLLLITVDKSGINLKKLRFSVVQEMADMFENVKKLTKLTWIEMVGSEVMSFDVSSIKGFNALMYLGLTNTLLFKVPSGLSETNEKVSILDLGSNYITKIAEHDFAHWDSIQVLVLSNNFIWNIEPFAFGYLQILEQLYLASNLIERIDIHSFFGLKNVKILDLYDNRIEVVESDTLKHLILLEQLILEKNPIRSIHPAALDHSTKFKELNIKENKISDSAIIFADAKYKVIE